MGLDCSHEAWHGAYSAFTRWRDNLARAAGYGMLSVEECRRRWPDEHFYFELIDIPWDMFESKNYMGEWDNPPGNEDPLMYLIVHSDCDGVLHPNEARHLADRLEQLLPKLDDTTPMGHIAPHMRGKTQQFIDGLRAAVAAGEDLDFH